MNYLVEHARYLNIVGIFCVLSLAYFFSRSRNKISYRLVGTALGLNFLLAGLVLKTAMGQRILNELAYMVNALYSYAEVGAQFVFGNLVYVQVPWGFIFAFRVLPIVIFFGALMALLLHFKIIQYVTYPVTVLMYRLLGTSAAETLCTVANSFLGQTEAPLLIRDYLPTLTESEMLTVMIGGMATISGPLLAVYGAMGVPVVYLLASSIMAIPGALLISKMLIPETQETVTKQGLSVIDSSHGNVLSAVSAGTQDGLHIALAVGAMLIAFIALIACGNGVLAWTCVHVQSLVMWMGFSWTVLCVTFQDILGKLFAPIGWLLGLTGAEIDRAGQLVGIKLMLNELVAYGEMVKMQLSDRAIALISFSLCGYWCACSGKTCSGK